MCGIAGVVPYQPEFVSREALARMSEALRHRGPDDRGCLVLDGDGPHLSRDVPELHNPPRAVLLHRRLSILDLSDAGRQPLATPDGRLHVVLNGEIYNYVELRDELSAAGHIFRTRTDTEVLLRGYLEWGAVVLARAVGMFAFAILDATRDELFLARDPLGIKPLYFVQTPLGFAFASEIPPLLDLPGVARHVEPARLYTYLRYGITDFGERTLLRDVRQLPAAHSMTVRLSAADGWPSTTVAPRSAPQPRCYWSLAPRLRACSFEDAASELRTLFLDSVRLHLRSDVPVGAALSGGVDSSAIVCAVRRVAGPSLELHVFGYSADDPAIDEAGWIAIAAKAAGATPHLVRPVADELASDAELLVGVQGEPFASTSIYAQTRVFRLARECGLKVLLDGQGADEFLAGYRPLLAQRLLSLVRAGRWGAAGALWSRARRLPGVGGAKLAMRVAALLMPGAVRDRARAWVGEGLTPTWLNRSWFEARGVRPVSRAAAKGPDALRAALWEAAFESSLPMLLRYEDRNSMAHSIESRVPFVTPRLAEFCLSLPEEYLIGADGRGKAVFRAAMRGIVPDSILDRRDKIGFEAPQGAWLRRLAPWVERVLAGPALARVAALRPSEVLACWRATAPGGRVPAVAWRWVSLALWAERFDVTFAA